MKFEAPDSADHVTKEAWEAFRAYLNGLAQTAYGALPGDRDTEREWFAERSLLCEQAEATVPNARKCYAWHDAIGSSVSFKDAPILDLSGEFSLEAFYKRTIERYPRQGSSVH